MEKILKKYKSCNDIIYLDVNCKRIKPRRSCIIIQINNVYLYTDSDTFTGVFEFTENLNINGKKIWKEAVSYTHLTLPTTPYV